jgi:hypothetical protein
MSEYADAYNCSRCPLITSPPSPVGFPCTTEGFAWQGTHVNSLFGWAHDIQRLLVTIGVAAGLCFLGVSTFSINAVDRRPHGSVAVLALVMEPFLAAGFARGMLLLFPHHMRHPQASQCTSVSTRLCWERSGWQWRGRGACVVRCHP